ncbi:hypothetical protein [Geodermatophilus africanus]|uniref:hypothetical protein n=1 Tax=Geodermatophilus africanus TaxID=1137993 RepID=UPI0011150067|nr:hypothetical protein [Geodermatophilus africanus]
MDRPAAPTEPDGGQTVTGDAQPRQPAAAQELRGRDEAAHAPQSARRLTRHRDPEDKHGTVFHGAIILASVLICSPIGNAPQIHRDGAGRERTYMAGR